MFTFKNFTYRYQSPWNGILLTATWNLSTALFTIFSKFIRTLFVRLDQKYNLVQKHSNSNMKEFTHMQTNYRPISYNHTFRGLEPLGKRAVRYPVYEAEITQA